MVPAPETTPTHARDRQELAGLRVLLVEDNLVNRKLAKRILEKLGCCVDVAENGAEGVRMHESASYDAVFMDCQMPVMDGYEATTRIRAVRAQAPADRHLPIIAVTANVLPGDRIRCMDSGMDDVIAKPVHANDFATALARWCGYGGLQLG
ncbi:MAG: response regulator [Krumholzibacteria bacterium]|nr:response regulator [Candidatus Krumholzibacteria bacterium]